jgi:hypothetical protein
MIDCVQSEANRIELFVVSQNKGKPHRVIWAEISRSGRRACPAQTWLTGYTEESDKERGQAHLPDPEIPTSYLYAVSLYFG